MARLLGIAEQGEVFRFGKLCDARQVRRGGLDVAGGVALDQVGRDVPAFHRADEGVTDAPHQPLVGRVLPNIAAADPLLGEDLHVVIGDRLFEGDRVAGNGFGAAAEAAFQNLPRDGGDEFAAFPIHAGESDRAPGAAIVRARLGAPPQHEDED